MSNRDDRAKRDGYGTGDLLSDVPGRHYSEAVRSGYWLPASVVWAISQSVGILCEYAHGYSATAFQAGLLRLEAATMSNRDHRAKRDGYGTGDLLSDVPGRHYSEG